MSFTIRRPSQCDVALTAASRTRHVATRSNKQNALLIFNSVKIEIKLTCKIFLKEASRRNDYYASGCFLGFDSWGVELRVGSSLVQPPHTHTSATLNYWNTKWYSVELTHRLIILSCDKTEKHEICRKMQVHIIWLVEWHVMLHTSLVEIILLHKMSNF